MTEYEVQRRTVFIFIFIFIFLGEGKLKLKEKVIGAHENLKIFSQHLSFELWWVLILFIFFIINCETFMYIIHTKIKK